MKKISFIFSLFVVLFVMAGCAAKPMMDEIDKQGFYPYHNDFFNFDLSLPKEFQYYQTQRIDNANYTEVDIFVPTADTTLIEQVPGYAEPIAIRAYDKKTFDALTEADKAGLTKVGEKGGKVFAMKFWDKIPSDWKDKWTDAMKQQLIKNFQLK